MVKQFSSLASQHLCNLINFQTTYLLYTCETHSSRGEQKPNRFTELPKKPQKTEPQLPKPIEKPHYRNRIYRNRKVAVRFGFTPYYRAEFTELYRKKLLHINLYYICNSYVIYKDVFLVL